MNWYVKKKWLKALRSGEYEKGHGTLRSSRGYCCLGVLAEEIVPEFVKPVGSSYATIQVDFNLDYLPDDLAILWNLTKDEQGELSRINDHNDTFDPVIRYIEENL